MALLVLLFLDLVAPTAPQGQDIALYRQAMADHHLNGLYMVNLDGSECAQVAANSSDLKPLGAALERAARLPETRAYKTNTHFSHIGWEGNRAWVQLRTLDAVSCLLYRRAGPSSFRLVREIRLPQ